MAPPDSRLKRAARRLKRSLQHVPLCRICGARALGLLQDNPCLPVRPCANGHLWVHRVARGRLVPRSAGQPPGAAKGAAWLTAPPPS